MLLNFKKEWLKENNSFNTLNEICHQPSVWLKVADIVKNKRSEIEKFVKTNISKKTKIILTGAGTSEFIGNSMISPLIAEGYNISSIATTDITSNPTEYFDAKEEIILVSFARSGNSPESVATYELVNELGANVKNIVITCNKDGELAKKVNKEDLLVLLPDEANDKSFAMTSSFTGMIIAFYLVIEINDLDKKIKEVESLAANVEKNIQNKYQQIQKIAELDHERIVFLGSGSLKGFSQESHLKVLELVAGEVSTFYNSPLGFRHGPKSILNKQSIVIMMMNSDEYTRKYDIDLLNELSSQKQIDCLVILDHIENKEISSKVNYHLNFDAQGSALLLGLNYIIFAQLYAFYKSLHLGKTPDNPWPSGLVNRVVQGVKIHKFKK